MILLEKQFLKNNFALSCSIHYVYACLNLEHSQIIDVLFLPSVLPLFRLWLSIIDFITNPPDQPLTFLYQYFSTHYCIARLCSKRSSLNTSLLKLVICFYVFYHYYIVLNLPEMLFFVSFNHQLLVIIQD